MIKEKTKKELTLLHYNPNELLSKQRVLNFVLGARGLGKTYAYKKYATQRFINHGEQFIYVRRYKSDLKATIFTFFNDVKEEFPDAKLEVKNNRFYINGEIAGYAMTLASFNSLKASSYPLVTLMIYDEFLIEDGSAQRYMTNEPRALLNVMDTVARNRVNFRCVCLSNAVSMVNPYFIYFDKKFKSRQPDPEKKFNVYDDIIVEFPDSVDFSADRKSTPYGRLIDGLEYGDFSLNNVFVNDTATFIEKRTSTSYFVFNIVYNGLWIGFWADNGEGLLYASKQIDPYGKTYSLQTKDHKPNMLLIDSWRNNRHLKMMIKSIKKGYLRFDNQQIKQTCFDLFKVIGIK